MGLEGFGGFSLVKTWEDKLAGETASLSAMIKMMLMAVLIGEEGLIKSSNALGEDFFSTCSTLSGQTNKSRTLLSMNGKNSVVFKLN